MDPREWIAAGRQRHGTDTAPRSSTPPTVAQKGRFERDGSNSAALYRIGLKVHAAGGSREDFEAAAHADPAAASHLADQGEGEVRALDRAWENASRQRHREAAAAFADAPEHVQQQAQDGGAFPALLAESDGLRSMPEDERPDGAARVLRRAAALHVDEAQADLLTKRLAGAAGIGLTVLRKQLAHARRGHRNEGTSGEAPEISLAAAFEERHGDTARFDYTAGRWLFLNAAAHIWEQDTRGRHEALARAVVEQEVAAATNRSDRQRIGRASTVMGVVRLARAKLATEARLHDTNPHHLGTPAGVLHLPTGALLPPDEARAAMVTKSTAVAPADTAACPRWLRFIHDVTQGDAAFARHLQATLGYALHGANPEQHIIFIFGPGGNGKSVLLHVLAHVLGTYARAAPMDVFAAAKSERPSADLAFLAGCRLVTASETAMGRAWDEQRVKQMTGGDAITARALYGQFFTFTPAFLPIIAGNHKPRFTSPGEAERRRMILWPFLHVPPTRDPTLTDTLMGEAAGILRWLLDGYRMWWEAREAGAPEPLMIPSAVRAATDSYFAQEDSVQRWLDEAAEVASDAREAPALALASYNGWAGRNGLPTLRPPEFVARLTTRGFQRVTVKGRDFWRGFRIAQGRNPFSEDAAV